MRFGYSHNIQGVAFMALLTLIISTEISTPLPALKQQKNDQVR
jgi:hypothetical protein